MNFSKALYLNANDITFSCSYNTTFKAEFRKRFSLSWPVYYFICSFIYIADIFTAYVLNNILLKSEAVYTFSLEYKEKVGNVVTEQ